MSTNTPDTAVRSQSSHEATVARHLAEHPHGLTTRAIAEAVGISPSAAGKALAALAATGAATRSVGPVEHGRKTADIWTPAPAQTEGTDSTPILADPPISAPVSQGYCVLG